MISLSEKKELMLVFKTDLLGKLCVDVYTPFFEDILKDIHFRYLNTMNISIGNHSLNSGHQVTMINVFGI